MRNAERVIRAIILAAGGKVDVYHRDMITCDDAELMRYDNPAIHGITLEAWKRK